MKKEIIVTKSIIDRCIDFCEGGRNKSQFSLRNVKNDKFPQNLLIGNEIENEINLLLRDEISTREIARKLKITQPAVMAHIRYYKKGVEFYYEWMSFWEFIKPCRSMQIIQLFNEEFNDREKKVLKRNGILTLGDFLMLFCQHTIKEISYMKIRFSAQRKNELFIKIRQLIYSLIL